jgi:outer membrane protein OmpA-like peptidoglycan-associated protein
MSRLGRCLIMFAGLALFVAGCGPTRHPGVVAVQKDVAQAREQGAAFCAPQTFASAEAYLEFATASFEKGNRTQAEKFLTRAEELAAQAVEQSKNCQSDLDNDGIIDRLDADPYRAEDFDSFQDSDGAPEDDNDGDGFLDWEDKCPEQAEDFDDYEDQDGCPDNDNDFDGVPDETDECASEAEDIDGWQDDDGCPDNDNDNDKFPDAEDACPNHAETVNGFLDDDGCPDQLPKRRKFIALPQIEFLGGTAFMTDESKEGLRKFVVKLQKNPELHVRIESHTFRRGDEAAQQALTKLRAEAVKALLVEYGVVETRLKALAFGSQRPIADNRTNAGRLKNDRVDFIIYLP